jgi:hypothetical protein
VADAFEAMTAARPYRLTPLTGEQAMAELRKFAGIQFDPEIVDAFTKTHWAAGINDSGRATEPRPPVPLLAQAGGRMAQAAAANAAANTAGTNLAAATAGTNPAGTHPAATAGTNPAGTNHAGTHAADASAEGVTAPAPDPAS